MAITKEKKTTILAKIDEIKKDSESIVFVHFKGLGVSDSNAMRSELREAGVGYFVAKKTLIARSFGDTFEGEHPDLEGEIALAYSTDAIAPAQNIKDFAKKYEDNLEIVGGVFQGVYKSQAEMTEIAQIPTLSTLHGMFANFFQQPAQGIAMALQAVAEQKEEQAA